MFTNHGSKFTFWPKGLGKIFQILDKFGLRAGQKKAGQKKARQEKAGQEKAGQIRNSKVFVTKCFFQCNLIFCHIYNLGYTVKILSIYVKTFVFNPFVNIPPIQLTNVA